MAKRKKKNVEPAPHTLVAQGETDRGTRWRVERVDAPRLGRIYLLTDDTLTRAFVGEEPDTFTDADFDDFDPATDDFDIFETTDTELEQVGSFKPD